MQDQKSFSARLTIQRNGFSASRMTRKRRTSLLVRKRPVIRRQRRMPPLRSKGRKSHSGSLWGPPTTHTRKAHTSLALRGCRVRTESASFYSLLFNFKPPTPHISPLHSKKRISHSGSLWGPPTTRTRKAPIFRLCGGAES